MTWSVGAGLEGRGVILTGAAGGIGAAVARGFASAGAKVMAVDLDQARLDDLVGSLEGSGHVGGSRRPERSRPPTKRSSRGRSRNSAGCTSWRTSPPSCVAGARLTR